MRGRGGAGRKVGVGDRSAPGVLRVLPAVLALAIASCQSESPFDPATDLVIVGAYVWDGTGATPGEPAVIQISEGRILSVEPLPEGELSTLFADIARQAMRAGIPSFATGQYVIPGLINTHGHVGGTWTTGTGVEYSDYAAAELARYARFGVTTVASLGGDREASFGLRDASWGEGAGGGVGEGASEDGEASPPRARLLVAGPVVTGSSPEEAAAAVDAAAAMGPDWIKIRVDDNLGATTKMSPETYAAVIARAREYMAYPWPRTSSTRRTPRDCCAPGTGMVAHSIRDEAVDEETISSLPGNRRLLRAHADARGVHLCLWRPSGFLRRSVPDVGCGHGSGRRP